MPKKYSRLARVEQKRAVRSASLYILLSIGVVLFLVILGPTIFSQLTFFLSRDAQSGASSTDTIPPIPPQIRRDNGDYSKSLSIKVTGKSEPGSKILLHLNNRTFDLFTDTTGEFSGDVTLEEGSNTIFAEAIDASGNISTSSQKSTIVYDNTPPSLEMSAPSSGQSFNGNKQQNIRVEGKTDGTRLVINDRIIIIGNNGQFSGSFTLQQGENIFVITALDDAGNETKQEIVTTFNP